VIVATWEEIRHQVVIAGQVINAQSGQAIVNARIQITDAPEAFTGWLAIYALQFQDRWETLARRPDRVRTAADGAFYFIDLPDGSYTLAASLPGSGTRYGTAQTTVNLSRNSEGNVNLATATLALPATTISGQITGPALDGEGAASVAMAEIRILGSGERTFSDGSGEYRFTGVEAGERIVRVSALGYQQGEQNVRLGEAGGVQTLNFSLSAA
jgi:hypothetical protein